MIDIRKKTFFGSKKLFRIFNLQQKCEIHRFFNKHPYFNMILENYSEKNSNFFSKSPADKLKRCRIQLEDYENPSVLKYIFSLPRYIDSSISAECLKARSVNFKFLLLIKYSETFFGILKLFSYVYRSFCIRFFHQKCFPVKPEILKYIFSLKNYLDFIIFAELKFKFHRKKCYEQKMRNHRYTYENNLRMKKTF